MLPSLIWNFEFISAPPLPITSSNDTLNELKWELRYFWSDDNKIILKNIDDNLLNLARYEHKFKEDYYYLLPENDFNIKLRRNDITYKPLIKKVNHILGFGPKIILDKKMNDLLQQVKTVGIGIPVKKEAYTYKFACEPTIKLELSRIEVLNKVYYSACLESRSLQLVETISHHLLDKHVSCEYVSFLKQIVKL